MSVQVYDFNPSDKDAESCYRAQQLYWTLGDANGGRQFCSLETKLPLLWEDLICS